MAASIPNLNTLRRGRARERGGVAGSTGRVDKDVIIRNTDSDAATSRLSAVEAGYLDDPFAKHLTDENWQRRLPLMNRGTYVRTTGIDRIVDTFLSCTAGPKQIISLGAGSDTRYFRLKQGQHTNLSYHEFDFRENNTIKITRLNSPSCIQTIKALCNVDITTSKITEDELQSEEYFIHSQDLRNLPEKLKWINQDVPTLFISECCLIYLPPEQADCVLSYFSDMVPSAPTAVVIYEPIRPNDPFGQTMIKNLTSRGIQLQTIEKYSDLQTQQERLTRRGFTARAADIEHIWRNWIEQEEKDRIDRLEWMDEVEEFLLLAKHYCISWGWRNYDDQSRWLALPAPT